MNFDDTRVFFLSLVFTLRLLLFTEKGSGMLLKTSVWIPVTCLITCGVFLLYFYDLRGSASDFLPRLIRGKILTIICCDGRLGNKMSSYAVLYGLAKLNKRQAVVPTCNGVYLKKIFEINLPIISLIPEEKWTGHKIGWIFNSKRDSNISSEANILTGNEYPDSITFFDFARQLIKKEFRFREHLRNHAQKALKEAQIRVKNATTFVGVHVRRSDYLNHLKRMNRREATVKFYKLAFKYFREKYKNIVFVVASDDINWCLENLTDNDVFVRNETVPAEYDLATLAHCNHSIISYGTYAFWSAYLAGGDTVYLANSTAPGSWFDLEEPENTFYLPEWVGISEIEPDFWTKFNVIPKLKVFELD